MAWYESIEVWLIIVIIIILIIIFFYFWSRLKKVDENMTGLINDFRQGMGKINERNLLEIAGIKKILKKNNIKINKNDDEDDEENEDEEEKKKPVKKPGLKDKKQKVELPPEE